MLDRLRRDPMTRLEADLRARRPEPRDEFVEEVARTVVAARTPRVWLWARTGIAVALLSAGLAGFAAYGGVGHTTSAFDGAWETVSDAVTPSSEVTIQNGTPAVDQYGKGDEGCTPGFWKNPKHFDEWTGASPGDSFNATFGVTTFPGLTLLDALNLEGGGAEALARAAVAALLNANSPGVAYPFTAEEVKAMVKAALDSGDPDLIEETKDTLDAANNLDCPLNGNGD